MLALDMSVLSLALLGAAAMAFSRQRRAVLLTCGALFLPAVTVATVAVFWPVSPALAIALLVATLGPSVLALLLFWVDRAFAPFSLEMTYPAMVCWLLWPALVAADFVGLAVRCWVGGAT